MYVCMYYKLMFSLNEQKGFINDFLDVLEVDDTMREMKNKCQSFEFDNINIALKHSMLPENIKGQIKEFDDNIVHEKHCELEKQIFALEHEHCRIDMTRCTWYILLVIWYSWIYSNQRNIWVWRLWF